MAQSGRRRVQNAFTLGLVVGVIGLVSQLTSEGISQYSMSIGRFGKLAVEAITPALLFAFLAWLLTMRRRNRLVTQEAMTYDDEHQWQPTQHGHTVSRVSRGFHRVGIVLATPPLLLGAYIACSEIWWAWSTSGLPPEQFAGADGKITLVESFNTHHADYNYVVMWIGAALVAYVMARAVGWVLDGFLSPSHS